MASRKLRFIKHTVPAIGICERCNSEFKSSGITQTDAKSQIRSAYDAHKCTPSDQDASRIVPDSTENK